MKGLPFVLAFTAMTFIAWGAYGPLLHHGTLSMGNDSLRAFVGVGIAYFFIAVLVPIYILRSQGEAGKWTLSGTFYSLFAGSVGALGALGVILALAYGGSPIYVMPLVFGFAPIVNTLVTAWMSKTFDQISPVFISGIVVAALGVAGVLAFKPAAPSHAAHPPSKSKSDDHEENKTSKDHTLLNHRNSVRFVSSMLVQEPTTEDPLPPVVVQPAAPETQPTAPTSKPAPAAAPEQPVAPEASQQELPPVVVQPSPPADSKPEDKQPAETPADAKPTPVPATPAAQEPPAELPPVVVQPAPLQQSDTKTPDTKTPVAPPEAPKVDTPKVDAPKSEAPNSETAKPEAVKPEVTKPEVTKPESAKPDEVTPEAIKPETLKPEAVTPEAAAHDNAAQPTGKVPTKTDVPMIILSIVVAAICWGSYGPMLHQGQARMGGSRLRPFTCVGLAYFFIAVAAPLAAIYARTADTGSWSFDGLSWSIVAGAAGAIGALGVILAFNAGGKPYYVMPLVFGFAPVINTCISLTEKGTWGLATPMFWISLGVVIAGAITVLLNAPKPKHAKPVT